MYFFEFLFSVDELLSAPSSTGLVVPPLEGEPPSSHLKGGFAGRRLLSRTVSAEKADDSRWAFLRRAPPFPGHLESSVTQFWSLERGVLEKAFSH